MVDLTLPSWRWSLGFGTKSPGTDGFLAVGVASSLSVSVVQQNRDKLLHRLSRRVPTKIPTKILTEILTSVPTSQIALGQPPTYSPVLSSGHSSPSGTVVNHSPVSGQTRRQLITYYVSFIQHFLRSWLHANNKIYRHFQSVMFPKYKPAHDHNDLSFDIKYGYLENENFRSEGAGTVPNLHQTLVESENKLCTYIYKYMIR